MVLYIKVDSYVAHILYEWLFSINKAVQIVINRYKYLSS